MKCSTSNIQLETIISRIEKGTLNLQPDFQRGEVWSLPKQKKLIDTILRNWTIPPIHIITSEYEIDEVLDGQQRLAAIRDFYNGNFTVDGNIEPCNKLIKQLDGLTYEELPPKIKLKFDRYEIGFVKLGDYNPSEPAELFDRLNQPMKLTSAEQRNAYIGETRRQIKELAMYFEKLGASVDTIGFSNSRLAYDEIIAKFCYAIEIKTLRRKIVASDITARYREDDSFSDETIKTCKDVLSKFMNTLNKYRDTQYKLKVNKATIYSWFVFLKKHPNISDNDFPVIVCSFETLRDNYKGKLLKPTDYQQQFLDYYYDWKSEFPYLEAMLNVFNQRASMGSTDALSIIYRDIILNIFAECQLKNFNADIVVDFNNNAKISVLNALEYIYKEYNWGEEF